MNSLPPVARWVASLLAAALVAAGVLIGPGTATAAAGPPSPVGGKPPVGGVERLVPLPGVAWAQRALISADGRRAYVGEETPTGSRIGVVDTRSGAVLAEVQTAPESWSGTKTFAPDGRSIYLLGAGTLNIFDTSTNTVRASVPLPEQPHPDGWRVGSPYSLAVSPDGATVYVGQGGPFLDAPPNPSVLPGRLLTFSAASRTFTGETPLPTSNPRDLVLRPGGATGYLSSPEGLIRLDLTGARPAVVRTITSPGFIDDLALAPNGATVYAQTKPEGRIQVIDLTTDTLAATIDLNTGFRQIAGLAVNPRGSRLYVLIQTNLPSPTVAAYSTATNRPVPKEDFAEFDLEHGATLTVGPDGHTFYVTGTNYNYNPGTFLQIVSF
ncbi:YncE family protein [Kitasatospora purpeofusca]|uniref:YncE family protein n=1 Tax=Kitasatospora purpeofusca TaxID=67352 RepID=UPI00386E9D6D|nr:hypothetical protein OIP63_38670 [Kitasatospora purpeofusca]